MKMDMFKTHSACKDCKHSKRLITKSPCWNCKYGGRYPLGSSAYYAKKGE